MIASSDVPSPAILLFHLEGDELALKESFPVEESVFNIARSGDGTTAAVQVRPSKFNTDTPFEYDRDRRQQRVVEIHM